MADPVGLLRGFVDALADGLRSAEPSALDVVLGLLLVGAVVSGLRIGLVTRATRLAGLALGLLTIGLTVPPALAALDPPTLPLRAALAVAVAGATVVAVTALVGVVTAPLRALLRLGPLSVVDRAAGAVASGVAAVLIAWLLLPAAAAVPGRISAEVRGSVVLGAIDAALPPQPDVTRSLRALVGLARSPEPFLELAPTPAPTAPPPDVATVADAGPAATEAGLAGATWVHAVGCGRLQTGSGFAVDTELIVTNAHVVAGGRELTIEAADGSVATAVVVVFDPGRDLALLSVPGHGLRPLPLADAEVGDLAVVVGHPGGVLDPRVTAARVDRRVLGVGRDIYGEDGAERDLLFLAAELRPGDSGAPVVGAAGDLLGVVFAVSPDEPTVAYAVTSEEVREVLALPRVPGDPGDCI